MVDRPEALSPNLQALIDGLCKRIPNKFVDMTEDELSDLKDFVYNFKLEESDWKKFVYFSPDAYTRNLVDRGNGNFDLLLLGWGSEQYSTIHDHAGSHCIMRVLEGELEEIRYRFEYGEPPADHTALKITSAATLTKGQATYIHDNIGWHRVGNPASHKPCVTLHVYSPSISGCHYVDDRSGGVQRACSPDIYSFRGLRFQM